MEKNPIVVEHCVVIPSKLLDLIDAEEAIKIVEDIKEKFISIPN